MILTKVIRCSGCLSRTKKMLIVQFWSCGRGMQTILQISQFSEFGSYDP